MKIKFLGTNGWFSTSTGSTTCAALMLEGRLIVLDAGEGFFKVPALAASLGVRKIDVFISHLHLDHVIGLHTLPLFPKGSSIRLFVHKSYAEGLARLLSHPYTASAGELFAKAGIFALRQGKNAVPYEVEAQPLLHVDPSWGYRFRIGGKAIAYCTDTGPCENLARLGRHADALIAECALLPGESRKKAWPHLSPQMAASAARQAQAKKLFLTHFDANKYRTNLQRKEAERAARKIFANAAAAKDGQEAEI